MCKRACKSAPNNRLLTDPRYALGERARLASQFGCFASGVSLDAARASEAERGIIKMKKNILDRYSQTADNEIIIDIAASKIEDLFSDFDKHAPYRKKELDQDLVDYLIDSASEIGRKKFVIHFHLKQLADENLTSRVTTSVRNYFLYLVALEFRELRRMARSSLILFAIGIVVLFLSVWVNQKTADNGTVISHLFAEGLTVAAWVSLWNAIANLLIDWAPHRRLIKMYKQISKAKIVFHQTS